MSSNNNNLLKRFLQFNAEHKLFSAGQKVCIALSGGIDSVVLFDLFMKIRQELDIEICAAHLNHQLRGEEADSDQAFVERLCASRNVPCFVDKRDVKTYARERKMSTEEAAREVRYVFLKEIARRTDSHLIALAHNANDQAETFLDHLTRGAGLAGLGGMVPVRENFIRPLLFAPRKDIELYARQNSLAFRFDSTNTDISYKRNRIRHELLPLLEKYNPCIISSLNKTASILGDANAFMQNQAQEAYNSCLIEKDAEKIILDIESYLVYFRVLQWYILAHTLKELNQDERLIHYDVVERITNLIKKRSAGKKVLLTDQVAVTVTASELVFSCFRQSSEEIILDPIAGLHELWDGWILEINGESKPLEQMLRNGSESRAYVDADLIQQLVKVRTWRRGDRFQPINFAGSKKLSDFFIDLKVPFYLKKRIPILECPSGIVWVAGYRLDDRFKVTAKTKNVLRCELRKNAG
jgi:tRNA(Ile)-lysidine synthase